VALPAFAAAERNTVVAHRAAAPLVLTAGPPAVLQSIDVYCRQAHSSKPAAAACSGR